MDQRRKRDQNTGGQNRSPNPLVLDDVLKSGLEKAASLAKAEKYKGAFDLLDQFCSNYPQEAQAFATRAYVHAHKGNPSSAIADWSKAIELRANEPHFFLMRGIEFLKSAIPNNAISDFTRVLDLCDHYDSNYYRSAAYLCRADGYLRLNKILEARLDCERVPASQRLWTDRLISRESILAECADREYGKDD